VFRHAFAYAYAPPKYTELAVRSKADKPDHSQPAGVEGSGKFVIVGILGLALVAAGGSWLVRYNATHRAARFWGPETARLIRDAPQVKLYREPLAIPRAIREALPPGAKESDVDAAGASVNQKITDSAIDVSNAHGLVHLRNALLDDRNFNWPADEYLLVLPDEMGYWWLQFEDPMSGKAAVIWFSRDCSQALRTRHPDGSNKGALISSEPIAAGLREIFAEFAAQKNDSAVQPGKPGDAPTTTRAR
jgi:hypothetical protein